MINRRYPFSSQRGLAIVEFAVCAPLLALALFAVAEAGILFYRYTNINKSVIDGARYLSSAATGGVITSDVQTKAKNLVVYGHPAGSGSPIVPWLQPAHVTIACTYRDSSTVAGSNACAINDLAYASVTVTVEVTYEPVLGSTFQNLTNSSLAVPLRASVTQALL